LALTLTQALDTSTVLCGPDQPELIRPEILADLFEATACAHPQKIALSSAQRQLTYGQLDALADLAASHLISAGVEAGQIVGLWLPRGIDLLVMQLAIAKTGAAWLPLDADTPVERIKVCLQDAASPGIVTSTAWAEQLLHLGSPVWTDAALLMASDGPLQRRSSALSKHPHHPAYVIYTSGSTGKPKGIEISQGSICHFLRSENAVLGVRLDDRVYQGFSVAFDMSFEEIWISYLVGATLWLASKEIAVDPHALPQALIDNHITVLHAVPTLLALFGQDVPNLRLINLGGEMCPESLVAKWARPGRQVFNTYGPTEACVSASLAELHAGQPVTIGKPLPNYRLLVIAPDMENGLRLLPQGETGELCISGPGVAAGYLGRPELTAEKFLPNPWQTDIHDNRLYRTGDLARIDGQGQVQCLGRADDQVKIRGFRVELGEIEALLAKQVGVGTAAVLLRQEQGVEQLVAFMVMEAFSDLCTTALRTALAQQLPPYMVPSRFEVLTEMPRLSSGKIDRKALKAMPLALAREAQGSDTPETPLEVALFAALAKLFPGQAIVRGADFFADLGGHSLFAAKLASALRSDARFAHVTVGHIYQHRVVGRIASALESAAQHACAQVPDWTPPSRWSRWRCGLAQAVAMPALLTMRVGQWLAPFFTYHFFTGGPEDSVPFAVLMSVLVFLGATLLEFGVAIVGKWLIAGRLQAGRYPLWGLTYFRWWLADQMIESAPVYLISGSSLHPLWLRALGARIGRDVNIGAITLRCHDLLSIGDGASIGNAVNLENARVQHGYLLLGPIDIQANAQVGSYAVLEGNTSLGEWAHLDAQSALADGCHVPAKRIFTGSPAQDVGAFDPSALQPRPQVSTSRVVGEGVFFFLGAMLIAALFFLPVFPTFMLIDRLDEPDLMPWLETSSGWLQLLNYFVLALPASGVMIVCTALLSAAIRWGVLPRLKSGSWPVHSNLYCGKWLVNQIQESSLHVLHGVYATVYAPHWYRLLGAKVGRDAEISTALGVVPDMLTLGDETFIADAVLLGDEEIDGGWMRMQPTVISKRSFVGNGAYIPDGTVLPENVLIGVLSRAPRADQIKPGDTWLGSPPIHLPAREIVTGYPESLTYKPSTARRLGRTAVETFRIVAPHAVVISAGYAIVLAVMPAAGAGQWCSVVWELAIDGMLFSLSTFVFAAAFKWLFIGRYSATAAPMWTKFVWLSEAATNLFEGIAVPNFMRYLRGTPWLPLAFQLLGCKMGKGIYLNTTDLTEFDCITIGDHAELNALVCPQTHLFEDRIMKIDHVHIGTKVTIGPRSTVLYSAQVGQGAQLGPMTLVMKGEAIPPRSHWVGNPATPH
jgi:non-ribosomal peptide synthetase-like protein